MSYENLSENQTSETSSVLEPGLVLNYQGGDVQLGEAIYPWEMLQPYIQMQNLRAAAHGRHVTMLAEAGLLSEYEEAFSVIFDKENEPLPMVTAEGDLAGFIFGKSTDEESMVIARFDRGRFVGITFGGIANGQIMPTLEMDFTHDGLSEVRVLDYRDRKLKAWGPDDIWDVPNWRRPRGYR
jgi:hypothetical protein